MRRWLVLIALALVPGFVAPCPALACSICTGTPQNTLTLRQDMAAAKLVLYGTLANPKLNANGNGTTDLVIERVLKNDPFLNNRPMIELTRYVPVDPKNPPKFLVFCDIFNGKIDPYRGIPVKNAGFIDYLKGVMNLDAKDRTQALLYYFRFLDSTDQDISNDAFLEFAKATDPEVGQVAGKLSAEKIRAWMQDTQTEQRRLSLYAFLLGACGGDPDAAVLRAMIEKPTDRTVSCLGGIMAGYIQLRPREGWDLAHSILRDARRPFGERFGILATLRFFHGWKADESRRNVVRGLGAMLDQGDVADLAIEDLRRFEYWEMTPEVVSQFGKKSHDAPIMRRAIIRYALVCPRPEAKKFVDQVRKQDPDLVKDVDESLEFEKTK